MKTRTDFVSNSSSSSYVFSANLKAFPGGVEGFAEKVLSQCFEDPKQRAECAEEDFLNKSTLFYHISNSELLYLGDFHLGVSSKVIRRGLSGSSETPDDFAKYEKMYRRGFLDGTNENRERVVSISADEIVLESNIKAPRGLTVLSDFMMNFICRPRWLVGRTDATAKKVVQNIVDVVRHYSDVPCVWCTEFNSSIYRITENTVKNTKLLIEYGYSVDLDRWENLDGIQARLAAGETVFGVTVSDSGDGRGNTKLFSFASRYPFKGLPLETLDCDG